jgi:hypothetical protein
MTGHAACFTELDKRVSGMVKFGDDSIVDIKGRGTVIFSDRDGGHRALTGVYFIPRLKSSIVSLGQLDEVGCQTLIENGILTVRDRQRRILASVKRASNRLYLFKLTVAQPVCLSACVGGDTAWRWHARYGHLNFHALRKLAQNGMVRGLPQID